MDDNVRLRDKAGIVHRFTTGPDAGLFNKYCERMDAIAELPRDNDITLGPRDCENFTHADLTSDLLTCVRCAAEFRAWEVE